MMEKKHNKYASGQVYLLCFVYYMKNYYEILEIQSSASQEVIKAAYRALVKKYHPDNYTNNVNLANEKLREIAEAYEILSDVNKRKKYDRQRQDTQKKVYEETCNHKQGETATEKKESAGGFFTSLFNNWTSIMNEQKRTYENTYMEALNMDERILAKNYKKATGVKRAGYAKALKELGILEPDGNGNLKPAYLYREYFR